MLSNSILDSVRNDESSISTIHTMFLVDILESDNDEQSLFNNNTFQYFIYNSFIYRPKLHKLIFLKIAIQRGRGEDLSSFIFVNSPLTF